MTDSFTNTITGIPHSAQPLVLAQLLEQHKTLLFIASSDREMAQLAASIPFFAPDAEIISFPAWDTMPYDRASPQASIMARRMQSLTLLATAASAKKRIILTTANAAIQKLPPKELMRRAGFILKKGATLKQDDLTRYLGDQGYRRASKAMEQGEFALRGGIIDIVPPGANEGYRIDLFGDEIESIKPYNPLTQITEGNAKTLSLQPVSEVMLSEENRQRFRDNYRELFGAVSKEDPLYESIASGHNYVGMEHWLPLFYEHTDTLFSYAPDALVVTDDDSKAAMEERFESIRDYYEARKSALGMQSKKNSFAQGAIYNPIPPEQFFLMDAAWELQQQKQPYMHISSLGAESGGTYRGIMRFAQGMADNTPFDQLRARQEASEKKIVVACYSEGSLERMQHLLMERGFHCLSVENWNAIKTVRGKSVGLALLPLDNGFETDSTAILSEQDILGERIIRAVRKKKKSEIFMQEAANFAEGELVVHKEHGIGRFEGLVTLTVQGASHDCLKIIYDGDDKLFLPVENIDLVSRYGLEEEHAKLDKLGSASWQARKAKLKERIKIAAEALIKTAAERQIKNGEVIEAPIGSYEEFAARFPYVETEDQERAITDVLSDLHSGRPMDRLICGDVGFGKTEVAMRAAFAAVSNPANKMQVAIVTPTTLLARQHYYNFVNRFDGLPYEIRQLSRMVPAKAQGDTRNGLKEGTVDIVIGTHALLAKNIEFKRLGLVIVDEEQHFGVAQKEKLKELKSDVHVLTLSATPIPRTLQMALTGVRDLSLITTPPVDRLAVRSFVLPYDPVILREALLREHHRGGKTFLVCPRIKDMAQIKVALTELVPEIKMAVAHGQMAPAELDKIMNDFYDGKYDALLSTAIIESGIDIPTANTMVIFNAHMFGLAQLYQLRGRVGRGKTRAYAYFVLPHQRELTKNATRRLEVMQTLDTLGAGFTLASHDMDIRGFGNLVGEEQSGHIKEVGIELYQQMLEDAVAELKKNVILSEAKNLPQGDPSAAPQDDNKDWSPAINLGLSVLIPESYVSDLPLRLGLYRRVADMQSEEEIDSFAAELIDRFGPMPVETKHLVAVLGIKIICKKAGIERIEVGPKGAVISLRGNLFAQPEKLLAYVDKNARYLKVRPDQKLVFSQEWKDPEEPIGVLKKLAGEIAGLAG